MLKDHRRLIHRLAASADLWISAILFIGLLSFSQLRRETGLTLPEDRRTWTTGLVATLAWWAVLGQLGETGPAREPVAADHGIWQLSSVGQ